MKILKSGLLILMAGIFLTACAQTGESQTQQGMTSSESGPRERNLNILTSAKIVADMIDSLSEGQHTIRYMTESESDLRSIVPNPEMMTEGDYQAFFYVGASYEPFIRQFTEKIDKNKVNVVNISRGIDILRHKINKLDHENYYYLMNSTNYKIALNSIKNSLQEMDPARKQKYDERFVAVSRKIDDFQGRVKDFMSDEDQLVFVVDSDLTAYVVKEYRKDPLLITNFIERKLSEESLNLSNASQPTALNGAEKRIFLYSDDVSLQKYADDITKYRLIPVRITLYDPSETLVESFFFHFERIQDAISPLGN